LVAGMLGFELRGEQLALAANVIEWSAFAAMHESGID
jgi:hypothetical protein